MRVEILSSRLALTYLNVGADDQPVRITARVSRTSNSVWKGLNRAKVVCGVACVLVGHWASRVRTSCSYARKQTPTLR